MECLPKIIEVGTTLLMKERYNDFFDLFDPNEVIFNEKITLYVIVELFEDEEDEDEDENEESENKKIKSDENFEIIKNFVKDKIRCFFKFELEKMTRKEFVEWLVKEMVDRLENFENYFFKEIFDNGIHVCVLKTYFYKYPNTFELEEISEKKIPKEKIEIELGVFRTTELKAFTFEDEIIWPYKELFIRLKDIGILKLKTKCEEGFRKSELVRLIFCHMNLFNELFEQMICWGELAISEDDKRSYLEKVFFNEKDGIFDVIMKK